MTQNELKKSTDKVFYYLNEIYNQAITLRNRAIDMAKELRSVLASTKMLNFILEISKLHTMAKAKIERESALLEAMLSSSNNTELPEYFNEQKVLWHELAEKIRKEADTLNEVADEIAQEQFSAFDSLEEYYKSKGLLSEGEGSAHPL